MNKPDKLREYHEKLVDEAKRALKRNANGTFNEEQLISAVADIVSFDPDAERRRKAKHIIEGLKRPGGTTPDRRQLTLPGFNLGRDWEPNRLVSDDAGEIIENERVLPNIKAAATRRAQDNLDRVMAEFRVQAEEDRLFQAWALQEALNGRPALELTWGNCVRENGWLS